MPDNRSELTTIDAGAFPDHEARRIDVLHRLGIVDTPRERAYDDVVRIAVRALRGTFGALVLDDGCRLWTKATFGMGGFDHPREASFFAAVVRHGGPVVVRDATSGPDWGIDAVAHVRPRVRSFVAAPVHSGGARIGVLWVGAPEPGAFGREAVELLESIARQVDVLFELRWRRRLAATPTIALVERLASRIERAEDFEHLLERESRPAWIYDATSLRFLAVNDSAVESYGWSRAEFAEMRLDDIRPDEDVAELRAIVATGTYRQSSARHWRHRRADGRVATVQVTSAPCALPNARLTIVTDLSMRLDGLAGIARAATHDSLTGLPNRGRMFAALEAHLADPGHRPVAVLLLDLDGFTLVNDMSGHAVGDSLIAGTAARISSLVRDEDTVARVGGDELAVVCPGTDEAAARVLAARLSEAMTQPFAVGDTDHFVSTCIGVAVAASELTAGRLVGHADIALLAAKAEGRGRCVVFDESLRRAVAERAALEHELRAAIRQNEFVVHYQPIIATHGEAVHFEALVRWQHPQRGLVPPGLFLPVADDAGLMPAISAIVLREVAEMTVRLRDAGLPTRIAFNLPAADLTASFIDDLHDVARQTGMDPTQLIVEVTESAFAQNVDAGPTAHRLRELGVAVSIDDFGSGYSSLDRLRTLEVDALKLDQSFIADVHTARGRGLVSAIVQLGRAIGVTVVAEGVETAEQMVAVRALGCDYAQGYLIARPGPESEAMAFLRSRLTIG